MEHYGTAAALYIANSENAKLSTGPNDCSATRLNAVKLGVFSKEVLLPSEDRVEFEAMARRMREDLSPEGEFESELVDIIIAGLWRLKRYYRAETMMLQASLEDEAVDSEANPRTEQQVWYVVLMKELHERTTLPKLGQLANRIWKDIRQTYRELMTIRAGRTEGRGMIPREVDANLDMDES
jgi:hypothetical protein